MAESPTTFPIQEEPDLTPTPLLDQAAEGTVPGGQPSTVVAPTAQAQGAAVQAARTRPRTNIADSVSAASSEWATSALYRFATGVNYEPQPGFDYPARRRELDFTLSETEDEFLSGTLPVSDAEFDARVARIKEQRENFQAIGDHPIMGGLTMMLDPAYIGLTVGSAGLGGLANTARVGRSLAAVSEAAGAVGIGYAQTQTQPIETSDIVTNALIGAAGAQLLFRGGRWAKADPDYPSTELKAVADAIPPTAKPSESPRWAQRLDAEGNPILKNGKPVYVRQAADEVVDITPRRAGQVKSVVDEAADPNLHPAAPRTMDVPGASGTVYKARAAGAVLADLVTGADALVSNLARHLSDKAGPLLDNLRVVELSAKDLGAKLKNEFGAPSPHYDGADHTIYVLKGTPQADVLHEVAHGATVAKINLGLKNPGTTHGKLVRELEELRQAARTEAKARYGDRLNSDSARTNYLNKNLYEFTAGLYSGDTDFLRMLAGMKAPGTTRSILSNAIDTIRRTLGLSVPDTSALAKAMRVTDDLLELPYFKGLEDYAKTSVRHAAPPEVMAIAKTYDSSAKKLGYKFGWNAHKTMAKWNKEVADLFMDDPLDMTGNSIENIRRAARADLSAKQYVAEELFKDEMAARGSGTLGRLFQPRKAMEVQMELEKEVYLELLRRNNLAQRGLPHASPTVRPAISKLADAYDDISKTSLDEMQRAGVAGADAVDWKPGYVTRRWNPAAISTVVNKFEEVGLTGAEARTRIVAMIAGAARRANGWTPQLANDVAGALYDRAVRKGDLSDSGFRGHLGNEAAAEVRDLLERTGLSAGRVQAALDVITGKIDEAGKAPTLKHRIDLDMKASMRMPDGSILTLPELLDTNLLRITDQYLDGVAARSAYAAKGLVDPSDIAAQRTKLIEGVPHQERADAARLFDDLVNYQNGRPAGEDLPRMMRLMQDVTQMVGLSWSGLWQVTEAATILGRYGLTKTLKYTAKNLPGFRGMLKEAWDTGSATDIHNVLTRNSIQDIRLRPYIQRMEDNFEYSPSDVVQAALKNAKQWVPYLNAMRFVHHQQAKVSANLIVDVLTKGARGDAKALAQLQKYGLEGHSMNKIAKEIASKGHDVANWSDEAWDIARAPLTKMMDEVVLRARTGEIPAFAQFSSTGKFIFTFRSFVLGAHNKVLAGSLTREGWAGLSLVMLYQWPLSMAAVQTRQAMTGKGPLEDDELVSATLAQFGSLGLLSELVGLVSGDKQQFGAPGFIALDRLWKLGGNAAQGEFGNAANDFLNAVPLLPIIPGVKALGESLK